MKKVLLIIMMLAAFVIGLVFGVVPLCEYIFQNAADEEAYEEIALEYTLPSEDEETIDSTEGIDLPLKPDNGTKKPTGSSYPTTRTKADFNKLIAKNSETAGWVQIPGTALNYPVLHTKDSQKYLNMNFNGRKSISGAIFSCGNVTYKPVSQNITLFGHNMGRGKTSMFSSLVRYKNKNYYNSHSIIYFDSLYQTGTYKIFSVFNIHVPNDEFNYTQSSFGSEISFQKFIEAAKGKSIYDTGVEVPNGAEILTLSTCDRSFAVGTGRFVVMAVKIGP